MLRSANFGIVFGVNIFIILGWHLLVLFVCKNINENHFNYNKQPYKKKAWEEDGRFYIKRLKIKLWKDRLPQYVSKNGFSKKKLDNLSLEYIDRFILETCRGEWAHKKGMLISVILMFINRFSTGFAFGGFVIFVNFPYVCIQRYNRIRLLRLRDKLVRQTVGRNNLLINVVKRLEVAK